MAVSFGIKSYIEGGVITFVILLNVVVGFFQEYSAEKTMDSLRSLSSPTASIVRDGESMVVPSGEIVPGDLVEIKTGDTIPADVRYALKCLFNLPSSRFQVPYQINVSPLRVSARQTTAASKYCD